MAEQTIQDEDYQKLLKNVVIGCLKKGLLCKGLHEVCKAIEAKQARFAILANNCDEQHYKMLIQALCKENNVKLLTVQDQGVLAEWIGICKLDATQQVRNCLLYTSPSPRDRQKSRMPSSA
eukprot:TRINITY_DN381_c0_g2_i8.p3 TRINITY_DN381_c0_g2~~TRINITY_DN381_c0_g2_i8.p3  ORF type:complete len:121 (-),score=27.33 TRINITY_DN381_c0_g2_i8:34-396(-)